MLPSARGVGTPRSCTAEGEEAGPELVPGITGVWSCPSIAPSRPRLLPAGRCGSAWTTRERLHLSPAVDAVGERRRSSFLGSSRQRSTSSLSLAFRDRASSPAPSQQQGFVSPRPDRSEILVLPSLFLPCCWGQHFIFQYLCAAPALGWGLALGSAWQGEWDSLGLAGGTRLSSEGLGSHPQSLKSCGQEGDITCGEWIYSSLSESRNSKSPGLATPQCETRPALGQAQFKR